MPVSCSLSPRARRALTDKILEHADRAEYLVMAGSLPQGTPADLYSEIIAVVSARCPWLPIAVDTSEAAIEALGEHLDLAAPGLIAPNGDELGQLVGVQRGVFEQAALAVAERETAGRAKPIITTLAHRIDPVPLTERHATAAEGRRVWVRDLDDGMAELVALLPAPLAYGIRDRLTQYARALRDPAPGESGAADDTSEPPTAADCRTMDQRRADVFSDLLLTGHATAEASDATLCETDALIARIEVTIPAATLTGQNIPATFRGHGPVDPDTARHLASLAPAWDRLHLNAATGAVEHTDNYRPTQAQRRLLRGRDEHCRFPGCRTSVWHCDIDHTVDYAHGGPTQVCNLAHLCKRHHMLKHNTAWAVVQHPGGILVWTSPTGRTYPDIPQRTLEFVAAAGSGAPPPF